MADLVAKNRLKILGVTLVLLTLVGFLFFRGPMSHIQLPAEPIGQIPLPGYTFTLTNTVLAAWFTIVVLVFVSWLATHRLELVPRGWQNLLETLMEIIRDLVYQMAGPRHGRRFLPAVATIFFFVLVNNWMGLLPGYGTIGWVEAEEHGYPFQATQIGPLKVAFLTPGATAVAAPEGPAAGAEESHGESVVTKEKPQDEGTLVGTLLPFLRSANSDVTTPLSLAILSAILVEFWGISTLGLFKYGSKFFNFKRLLHFDLFNGVVDLFIGLMELVSEVARLISFTFRLFGNVFAGEVLLAVIGFLMPWVIVLPFYGLELIVGIMQAFVFAVLTLVFGVMAVTLHGEGAHGEAEHGH